MSKYTFYTDPGHGWVKVRRAEVEKLDIATKITPYSYQRNLYVYLEEDCDLGTFIAAKKARNETVEFVNSNCRDRQSKIRSYDRFVA